MVASHRKDAHHALGKKRRHRFNSRGLAVSVSAGCFSRRIFDSRQAVPTRSPVRWTGGTTSEPFRATPQALRSGRGRDQALAKGHGQMIDKLGHIAVDFVAAASAAILVISLLRPITRRICGGVATLRLWWILPLALW